MLSIVLFVSPHTIGINAQFESSLNGHIYVNECDLSLVHILSCNKNVLRLFCGRDSQLRIHNEPTLMQLNGKNYKEKLTERAYSLLELKSIHMFWMNG